MDKNKIEFKKQAERILKKSIMEQKNLNEREIKTIHVLLAILLDPNNIITISFEHIHINYEIVIDEYERQYNKEITSSIDDDDLDEELLLFSPPIIPSSSWNSTSYPIQQIKDREQEHDTDYAELNKVKESLDNDISDKMVAVRGKLCLTRNL